MTASAEANKQKATSTKRSSLSARYHEEHGTMGGIV